MSYRTKQGARRHELTYMSPTHPTHPSSPTLTSRLPTGASSPLLYQAQTITQSLRDDHDRDTKEGEVRDQVNRQLAVHRLLHTPSPSSPSSNASRMLDEVLQRAHEVRNLQERELLVSTPNTPGRGSAAVDSLLTTMAKERDEAKSDFAASNNLVHRLRLELSDVSHKLATSLGDNERIKHTLKDKDIELETLNRNSRSHAREDIIKRAEISTQRDETNSLRIETNTLKQTARELMDELEISKNKVSELLDAKETWEQKEKDLHERVEAIDLESASLRDSLALITKDCEVQRNTAVQKNKEMQALTQEIEQERDLRIKEQQDKGDTEQVLSELMEQAQELRRSRDTDRSALQSAETLATATTNDMKATIMKLEQAVLETKKELAHEMTTRTNVEQAYKQLEQIHTSKEQEQKSQQETNTQLNDEVVTLKSQQYQTEELQNKLNELENDKLDLKGLLEESQHYLVIAKEEFEAKILSEEHRWSARLENERKERDLLEMDYKKSKNHVLLEQQKVINAKEKAHDQRVHMIRLEEDNKRLLRGNATHESIVRSFKQNIAQLQHAGQETLEVARQEALKNKTLTTHCEALNKQYSALNTKHQHMVLSCEEKTTQMCNVEVELKMARVSSQAMERKLMQSKAANIDLENNMDEFATTNRFLVKELEELKRSYSEFLSVSRESVRGVTKGGGGGEKAGGYYSQPNRNGRERQRW